MMLSRRYEPLSVNRIRWAVYISSNRDFSQEDSLSAAAHDLNASVVGHEKSNKLDPAVFRVRTLVYFFAGLSDVAGIVTAPRTWTNYD